MFTLRQVAQIGNDVFNEKVIKVTFPVSPEIRTLADEMIYTCLDAGCSGLAAPQVYTPLQLIILAVAPSYRHRHAEQMEPVVLCNPKVISRSTDKTEEWETCMSIPSIRAKVPRHTWITVQFWDLDGNQQVKKFEGMASRALQQKLDCLKGILFLQKRSRKIMSETEFHKRESKKGLISKVHSV